MDGIRGKALQELIKKTGVKYDKLRGFWNQRKRMWKEAEEIARACGLDFKKANW